MRRFLNKQEFLILKLKRYTKYVKKQNEIINN